MDRFRFSDSIKNKQNDKTINLIGKIDIPVLDSNKIESVYYSFPLIERMVLEIYKLVPEADIEHYEQGTMRTILSIIEENDNYNNEMIIPEVLVNLLKDIFGEDGPRNRMLHVREGSIEIKVSFQQINYIIMNLLEILKNMIERNEMYSFNKIEPLT